MRRSATIFSGRRGVNAMPFVAVPATVKVNWFYTLNGQPAMNRVHVSVGPTLPSAALCATIANAAAGWWDGNCKTLQTADLSLRETQAISIAEQNGPQASFTSGLPTPGTNINPALPGNTSFAVSLRSGLTGRSARGRWFWAGLTENQVVQNVVDGGIVTSIVAALDNLIGAMSAVGATLVIVSYTSNGIPRPGGPVKFIVTDALAVDNIVDSQRGRLH